jgi:hypothetical protein
MAQADFRFTSTNGPQTLRIKVKRWANKRH